MTIEKFRGADFFLSNMYPLENWLETDIGIAVPTSEHAYQAARFVDPHVHSFVAHAYSGVESKNLAHNLLDNGEQEQEDWDSLKVGVMYGIVREKFKRNPDVAGLLIATGDEELVEGNTWNDHFWGVCPVGSDDGQNQLGKIHMRIRDELKTGEL